MDMEQLLSLLVRPSCADKGSDWVEKVNGKKGTKIKVAGVKNKTGFRKYSYINQAAATEN